MACTILAASLRVSLVGSLVFGLTWLVVSVTVWIASDEWTDNRLTHTKDIDRDYVRRFIYDSTVIARIAFRLTIVGAGVVVATQASFALMC